MDTLISSTLFTITILMFVAGQQCFLLRSRSPTKSRKLYEGARKYAVARVCWPAFARAQKAKKSASRLRRIEWTWGGFLPLSHSSVLSVITKCWIEIVKWMNLLLLCLNVTLIYTRDVPDSDAGIRYPVKFRYPVVSGKIPLSGSIRYPVKFYRIFIG